MPVTPKDFLSRFASLSHHDSLLVDIGGEVALPVRGRYVAHASTLVVNFHGSVDRTKREYPAFLNYRAGINRHAHQLAIADTTLALNDGLTNGWFAGSEGTPLQRLLPKFITEVVAELGVKTLIFTGSSGGGFAAMYYSWHFPGSTAVVTVPQTNVWAYYDSRREEYLQTAWPDGTGGEHGPILDLREVYGRRMENSVVYLQSILDTAHVRDHMIPFLNSLPPKSIEQMVLKCYFWGKEGHSGAIPTEELDAWVRAAIIAESSHARDIVNAHFQTGTLEANQSIGSSMRAPRDRADNQQLPARDLQWSSLVADAQRHSTESSHA